MEQKFDFVINHFYLFFPIAHAPRIDRYIPPNRYPTAFTAGFDYPIKAKGYIKNPANEKVPHIVVKYPGLYAIPASDVTLDDEDVLGDYVSKPNKEGTQKEIILPEKLFKVGCWSIHQL